MVGFDIFACKCMSFPEMCVTICRDGSFGPVTEVHERVQGIPRAYWSLCNNWEVVRAAVKVILYNFSSHLPARWKVHALDWNYYVTLIWNLMRIWSSVTFIRLHMKLNVRKSKKLTKSRIPHMSVNCFVL